MERRGRRRAVAPEIGELRLETGESAERQLYGLLRRAMDEPAQRQKSIDSIMMKD